MDADNLIKEDTGQYAVREILDVLMGHGVETIVLSPGSRNAPLLIGSAAREGLKKYIINDERTAAFTALGIGIATQKPVALACTSGTALYNYAPAIAEAFYQHVPLIVLTADRPAEWVGQDSQTLRQPDALTGIVKRSYDLASYPELSDSSNLSENRDKRWYINRIANNAMYHALSRQPGPVHINLQFAVPFNNTIEYHDSDARIIDYIDSDTSMAPHLMRPIAEYILERKVLIIAGQMAANHKLNRSISDFIKFPNVALLANPTSNLHTDTHNCLSNGIWYEIDEKELKDRTPDVAICIGGIPVSERLKSFIRNSSKTEVWTLGDNSADYDGLMRLKRHYEISPERFFSGLGSMCRHLIRKGYKITDNSYGSFWKQQLDKCKQSNDRLIAQEKWNELSVIGYITTHLPSGVNLFLSNGMTIRNASRFIGIPPHNCMANRGVSGIEGTNATAFGASLAYKGTTILITGDMSFSYCPEVLSLSRLGGDLRIIVINNKGGEIFRQVKTTRDLECREEYFCSDPCLSVKGLTEAQGWKYECADSFETLKQNFEHLLSNPKTLLEIFIS